MLILSRKLGEVINIGNDIEIKILEVRGEQVRLGITAPRDTPVHREEIFKKIRLESPPKEET